MRHLIINADGYGFTGGITRAIERCVEFGTVRSISVNVNFPHAERLRRLIEKFPFLSVGCHVNPVVGRPVLESAKVPSLIDSNGEFFYKGFRRRVLTGHIKKSELQAEMAAQIEKTRGLAGAAFTHIDFHMGLHRLPGVYGVFLDVAQKSGTGRIRTHRYLRCVESPHPRARNFIRVFRNPAIAVKGLWNLILRKRALYRGLSMPDRWVSITDINRDPAKINIENYLMMLKNLPPGFSEFVVHPGYVDGELKRWSSYHHGREMELKMLLSERFRDAIGEAGIRLAGYRDIPRRS